MSQITRLISNVGGFPLSRSILSIGNSSNEEKTQNTKTVSHVANQGMQLLNKAGKKFLSAFTVIPKEIMVELGNGFRIIPQFEDGDCLFNSFISGLRLIKEELGIKWTFGWKANEEIVPLLRKQVADWIRQNLKNDLVKKAMEISISDFLVQFQKNLVKNLDSSGEVSSDDLERFTVFNSLDPVQQMAVYTQFIERKGFFGSNGEIVAICMLYDVSAIIHSKVGGEYITNPEHQFNLAEDEKNRPQIF